MSGIPTSSVALEPRRFGGCGEECAAAVEFPLPGAGARCGQRCTLARTVKFLQFIVVETLEGRGERLTESYIAEKVFNQQEFTPSEKSVVRVEKRRLRERLKDYYQGPGKDDPLVISLGSTFVPVFSPRVNDAPAN